MGSPKAVAETQVRILVAATSCLLLIQAGFLAGYDSSAAQWAPLSRLIPEDPLATYIYVPIPISSGKFRIELDNESRFVVVWPTQPYRLTIELSGQVLKNISGQGFRVSRLPPHSGGLATVTAEGEGMMALARTELADSAEFSGSARRPDTFVLTSPFAWTEIRVSTSSAIQVRLYDDELTALVNTLVTNGTRTFTVPGNLLEVFFLTLFPEDVAVVSISYSEGSGPPPSAPNTFPYFLVLIGVVGASLLLFWRFLVPSSRRSKNRKGGRAR